MPRLRSVKRALRDLSRRTRGLRSGPQRSSGPSPARLDLWLELFDSELGPIDAACAGGSPESFALFRDLDDDLWALLLTQAYEVYPNIRSLLPSMPDPGLQELWNGTSGVTLASQGNAFYRKLRDRHGAHSDQPLSESSVLDFGCGWGRLTRFLVRDVEPGRLYGCDPVEQILQVCRESRVPATLARSSFLPERLPFDAEFDLAFSFSVFTHLSEAAHESCLRALHASLRPGGLLVVTVRPPEYLRFSPLMRPALEALGPDPETRLREPRYIFVPHPAEPSHLQYDGGEMTYGETVVTLPYVRERWTPLFDELAVDLLVADPYQLVLTLRRR
jgi:SAM-dependent methyltransferase